MSQLMTARMLDRLQETPVDLQGCCITLHSGVMHNFYTRKAPLQLAAWRHRAFCATLMENSRLHAELSKPR